MLLHYAVVLKIDIAVLAKKIFFLG